MGEEVSESIVRVGVGYRACSVGQKTDGAVGIVLVVTGFGCASAACAVSSGAVQAYEFRPAGVVGEQISGAVELGDYLGQRAVGVDQVFGFDSVGCFGGADAAPVVLVGFRCCRAAGCDNGSGQTSLLVIGVGGGFGSWFSRFECYIEIIIL